MSTKKQFRRLQIRVYLLSSSVGKESVCNAGDSSLIPRSGRSVGEGKDYPIQYPGASLVAQLVKNHLQYGRPGFDPWVGKIPWRRKRPLIHSIILAWRIPWTVEFTGLQRVKHAKQLSLLLSELQFGRHRLG